MPLQQENNAVKSKQQDGNVSSQVSISNKGKTITG
jgi:hypothetical protein